MNELVKPTRINVDEIDVNQITQILMTGGLDSLRPDERAYYELMELVRGLRAKMQHNKKIITKAGIIKLLKSDVYGLSDWQARQVYADSINFFYTQEHIRPEAFSNLYADKLEKMADVAFLNGRMKEARDMIKLAAELRGCFKKVDNEIPDELLNRRATVIYTTDRADLGVDEIDRKELAQFIDDIPDTPEIIKDNIREDAKIKKFELKKRMIYDVQEFSEEDNTEG